MAMTPRRVLIADHEPSTRMRLRALLARHAAHDTATEAGDGRAAADALARLEPELVFLDPALPGLDGRDVVAAVEISRVAPDIVFVAPEGNAVASACAGSGAAGHLHRSFDDDGFARELADADGRLAARRAGPLDPALRACLDALPRPGTYPARFLVRGVRYAYFVDAADVEWVDAAANYVRLHTGGRAHLIRDTLTGFAARLPPDKFVRIHRSAIVNLAHVRSLEPQLRGEYVITLRDGTKLTSSRAHGRQLRELLERREERA